MATTAKEAVAPVSATCDVGWATMRGALLATVTAKESVASGAAL